MTRMVLVLMVVAACGGSSSHHDDAAGGADAPTTTPHAPTYTPTAVGTAVGPAATKSIDGAGGSVTSADGRLVVTIPAGAFAAATDVTIQAITNHAPNGVGWAYRLTPEGTTFATPVTLAFQSSAGFVATQHADGTWWSQPGTATADTVSVSTTHFSDWSIAESMYVSPDKARVPTTKTSRFEALVLLGDDDLLFAPNGGQAIPDPQPVDDVVGTVTWQVNGVDGGDGAHGTIARGGFGDATYTAPASPGEFTVSASLEESGGKVVALAPVAVYAQERWMGSSHIDQGGGVHADATFELVETSTSTPLMVVLEVASGSVEITTTPPSGCESMVVAPSTYQIGTNDGRMNATYTLATGPDSPIVQGQGTTAWVATYTTVCNGNSGSVQAGADAMWWPNPPGTFPMYESFEGSAEIDVSSQSGSGHISLTRESP